MSNLNVLRFMGRMRFLSQTKRLEWFPPFLFMRIKVIELTDDWSRVRIRLPLNAVSRNMGGSMFGGYQASLADPIAALACARNFPDYWVWTRKMVIDFQKPGSTHLELRFDFNAQQKSLIAQELKDTNRSTPVFEYGFYRQDGILVSKIVNTVAIRPKGYKMGNVPTFERL